MKEIGKLIELLNEYNDNKEGTRIGFIKTINIDGVPRPYELGKSDLLRWEEKIISKKYGFIKWLVENDKIETNNLSLKAFKNIFSGGGFVEVSDLEVLLMLLAISDTPIEDLLLYLK